MYGANINLMHIIIIGPLLFSIGYKNPGENTEFYQYLKGILGVLPFMLHFQTSKPSKWSKKTWKSIIHLILFLPFLGYVSYMEDNTPIFIYNILKILGIGIITIHSYLLIKKILAKKSLLKEINHEHF